MSIEMLEWFKTHVFIAAWASPIIALLGMILKRQTPGVPLNWPRVIVIVGFLTALAVAVTPGMDSEARSFARTIAGFGFGALLAEMAWHR